MYADEQLKVFLLDSGIPRSQLDDVAEQARQSGESLSVVLVESGVLSRDELNRAVARGLGIPFVQLPEAIEPDILSLIPEPLSRTHSMVAYAHNKKAIEVALLDVADISKLESLQRTYSKKLLARLTDRASMNGALLQYQRYLKEYFGEIITREVGAISPPTGPTEEEIRYAAERLPVVHVLEALLWHALHNKASSVHLEVVEGVFFVRYRIQGTLFDAMTLPITAASSLAARCKLLARVSLVQRFPQEGRFKFISTLADVHTTTVVTVATMPVMDNEKVVLHLSPDTANTNGLSLSSLGFHGAGLESLHKALHHRSGLVLVCGTERSGKTTLLYTLLSMLAGPHSASNTIEEKIERVVPHVTQTEVQSTFGLSCGAGLRAALRQDPDVVMISDIKDKETALLAVQAANRGVMVLAGVGAANAAEGVAVLQSLDVSPALVAATLRVSVGVRLVPRLCIEKEPQRLSRAAANTLESAANVAKVLAELKKEHSIAHAAWKDVSFFGPKSCAKCDEGYKDVLGLQEIMPTSELVRALILEGAEPEVLSEAAQNEGMLTLAEDAIYKAAQGLTSLEVALEVARSDRQ